MFICDHPVTVAEHAESHNTVGEKTEKRFRQDWGDEPASSDSTSNKPNHFRKIVIIYLSWPNMYMKLRSSHLDTKQPSNLPAGNAARSKH